MAKLETIVCAMTWGVMNALAVGLVLTAAAPAAPLHPAPAAQLAQVAPAPTA